jgi:peptidoglycan/xylan/chitin deacetylase (PgdA/CDA1 family)
MRLSVVIPSYQRRDLVVMSVQALARQQGAGAFEVIVVVDGSSDGTAAALRDLELPFPMTVLEQANRGQAAARNAGGYAARGDILLFLDDDMEADPGLVVAHDRSHQEGAQVVVGHIPLHPDSPRTLLSTWVEEGVNRRAERLSSPGASIHMSDLVGGQLSVARKAFLAAGGFDAHLACGEDMEFGYRLLRLGYRAVFSPEAISWRRYIVRPRQLLDQCRQSGRASVGCARKHPEVAGQVFDNAINRRTCRVLSRWPALVASVSRLTVALLERGYQGSTTRRLFFAAQSLAYCQGLRDAGGMPRPRPLRVLAYHALADTAGTGRFEPYGVRPEDFHRQIVTLQRAGYHFVSADEVVHFLHGAGGLPPRPVLLTFDDCYTSVLEHAAPLLKEHNIPAVAFAVTARLGQWNDWGRFSGAPRLPLLDVDGLRQLAGAGIEVGAHSRTHRPLPALSAADIADEVGGAREDLRAIDVGPVRLFAYPHGTSDERVRQAVATAGYQAAFSVAPGLVRQGSDPFRIARIEIFRRDVGRRFRWKVALGGSLRSAKGPVAVVGGLWHRWGGPILLDMPGRVRKWAAGS